MNDLLFRAVAAADRVLIHAVVAEAVTRYAGLEVGRAVAGTKRTSVIILGDGRSNYHSPRSWVLKSIRQRARHLYWLNPEATHTWDTGDSIASEYGRHCD